MSFVPAQLRSAAQEIRTNGVTRRETVRTFLHWFGVAEPGHYATLRIRQALEEVSLITEPDFASSSLDSQIELLGKRIEQSTDGGDGKAGKIYEIDPAFRVGSFDCANRAPTAVPPTTELSDAITIMIRNGYSQLPVMLGRTRVFGVVSWRSIGTTLHFRGSVHLVSDCIEIAHEVVASRSVFDAIPIIIEHDYVLVRASDNKITGIITAADLSSEFRVLAEPFLLVGEVEKYLRLLVDRAFDAAELQTARDPDNARVVNQARDLSFGEIARMLQAPSNFDRLRLRVGKVPFSEMLEAMRRIRNDVMHFRLQQIPPEDLDTLQKNSRFFRELANADLI